MALRIGLDATFGEGELLRYLLFLAHDSKARRA